MSTAFEQLNTFTLDSLPDLDTVVLGALELFINTPPEPFDVPFTRPLVMGSGNALVAAKILFAQTDAFFANESNFTTKLQSPAEYDGVVVVSASGGKHAVTMVEAALKADLPVRLITNTEKSTASQLLTADSVFVYSKNREPYTYNTSTYLGPILAHSNESAADILQFIESDVSTKLLRNFVDYSAVTFILPAAFAPVTNMINTKFDELFGPALTGRAFTEEEIKHAKTVVQSGDELFIGLGVDNPHYGLARNRLHIPLPETVGPAAIMAISYYIVGKIQAAHPPYFKQHISKYCETASKIFGYEIKSVVE